VAEITASRIGDVLRAQLESYQASVDVREVGTVIQIGDGIARVEGLRGAMAGELLEFVAGDGEVVYGMALNSMRTRSARCSWVARRSSRRTTPYGRPAASWRCPLAPACLAASSTRSVSRSTARAPSPLRLPPRRVPRAWRHRAQGRAPTGPDRPHGHRRDDPDRSWPA